MLESSTRCSYDMPLASRIDKMAIFQLVITVNFVESMFMTLPTTPPSVFEKLSNRKEFRVLYLVQGDYRSNLPIGRMALYIAGRLLELHQGWIYNYFVFLDDDPQFEYGNITDYELSIKTSWQPAIGYHREITEVMFPWILDNDKKNCTCASQLNQMQEAAAVYSRNHILAFKSLKVVNPTHRPYSRDCRGSGKGFGLSVKDNWESFSAAVKHCTLDKNDTIGPLFRQGSFLGQLRPKVIHHLMPASIIEDDVSMSGINDMKPYGMIKQTSCENTNKWSPLLPHCCTVDFSILNSIANDPTVKLDISPDHEKVISLPSMNKTLTYAKQ
eukprot:gene12218-16368_t